ncbi:MULTISPECIES: flagellin [Rhodobacterales]|uniref:flagellin N-terminal helical domain-containing protein n=1 Tax=Rhodobacterales TaxID=204455 RepID=UPI00237FCEF9|nr:flagellin [Phaeobacter gallaeciensis]MDE4098112.1 flagellin [Phaeobacter gallaeciensis]MDE4106922.1 flagellin [Phaeobacter gallaeciensis]MDE4111619.1 flagellin [Phaeobacter gallaeciensis]MDE4115847.1 flagellin [Phaeobacter gallaeciensis]MDE4120561.1 flagellin [Phaeobacter gallaeciensis]
MTSILTNNGAMVALQTLNSINMNLENTQNAISTGKDVATAKDNSAIWAISKVMESDVAGFNAVSDSLALGESTVAVATAGAEQITELLKEMKEKVVNATGENVENGKLAAEVTELKNQITSIIKGSQFNGANLLNKNGGNLTVLSSLDRNGTGTSSTVSASNITVASVNFEDNLSLGTIDVSNSTQAELSISKIESLIQTAINGAAALGASAARIEKQADFVSKVSDAMKSGIGALVDTDMEAASARLKALQTQQQLGVQALSIANSAPQTLQQLFR